MQYLSAQNNEMPFQTIVATLFPDEYNSKKHSLQ